ncbi:MAG: NfeD family protein [Flavobacteriaceae bacterium]
MEVWHILITTAIIAFLLEIFTAGFVAGSVSIGLLFAAIGNYFGAATEWQITLFALGVIISFFLIRPIISTYGYSKNSVLTNHEALLAKNGTVTEEIDALNNTGRVSIDGDNWKAKTRNNTILTIGTTVQVVAIDSIILIVEPLKH